VENEPMKITVLGAALLVASVIAAALVIRWLSSRTQRPMPPQEQTPGQ
jgi:membrane protein implicated in regulation of membrane protease activity